ncbi:MAG: hypothetical protein P3W91_003140 [Fervidobacterium sp.]|nr:hypothetical protein [Fervidobacterium sp.]
MAQLFVMRSNLTAYMKNAIGSTVADPYRYANLQVKGNLLEGTVDSTKKAVICDYTTFEQWVNKAKTEVYNQVMEDAKKKTASTASNITTYIKTEWRKVYEECLRYFAVEDSVQNHVKQLRELSNNILKKQVNAVFVSIDTPVYFLADVPLHDSVAYLSNVTKAIEYFSEYFYRTLIYVHTPPNGYTMYTPLAEHLRAKLGLPQTKYGGTLIRPEVWTTFGNLINIVGGKDDVFLKKIADTSEYCASLPHSGLVTMLYSDDSYKSIPASPRPEDLKDKKNTSDFQFLTNGFKHETLVSYFSRVELSKPIPGISFTKDGDSVYADEEVGASSLNLPLRFQILKIMFYYFFHYNLLRLATTGEAIKVMEFLKKIKNNPVITLDFSKSDSGFDELTLTIPADKTISNDLSTMASVLRRTLGFAHRAMNYVIANILSARFSKEFDYFMNSPYYLASILLGVEPISFLDLSLPAQKNAVDKTENPFYLKIDGKLYPMFYLLPKPILSDVYYETTRLMTGIVSIVPEQDKNKNNLIIRLRLTRKGMLFGPIFSPKEVPYKAWERVLSSFLLGEQILVSNEAPANLKWNDVNNTAILTTNVTALRNYMKSVIEQVLTLVSSRPSAGLNGIRFDKERITSALLGMPKTSNFIANDEEELKAVLSIRQANFDDMKSYVIFFNDERFQADAKPIFVLRSLIPELRAASLDTVVSVRPYGFLLYKNPTDVSVFDTVGFIYFQPEWIRNLIISPKTVCNNLWTVVNTVFGDLAKGPNVDEKWLEETQKKVDEAIAKTVSDVQTQLQPTYEDTTAGKHLPPSPPPSQPSPPPSQQPPIAEQQVKALDLLTQAQKRTEVSKMSSSGKGININITGGKI